MPDLIISQLPTFTAGLLADGDLFPFTDVSASDTKKIEAKQLFDQGVLLLSAGQIPADKINFNFAPNTIDGSVLIDNTVGGIKLANNATVLVADPLPAQGEYVGQFGLNATTLQLYYWSGAAWALFRASGSIYDVQVNNVSNVLLAATTVNGVSTLSAALSTGTAGNQFIASPDGAAGAMSYRTIVGNDLPIASSSSRGAVTVNGEGLALVGSQLIINNSVAASADYYLVTYSKQGLITGGRAILGSDLPVATSASPGAVVPGPSLAVTPTGQLNHSNSITPGTATKVNFDSNGHITQSLPLAASDIPSLDASKITSGTIDALLYGDRSISQSALADYSVAYIQEAEPLTSGDAAHVGMLWFQESTGALRMWNGNSWFPVGFGRLAQDNLRWGGLFDASTGLITGVTNLGIQSGLSVGGSIPGATDALGGLYLVCETGGNNIVETPGVTYDPGDWLLCVNQTNGWTRIDTLTGGGGGGASFLNDLLDVTISNPLNNQVLTFNAAAGEWRNQAIQAGVASVFGRTGAVVAAEGDYSLNLLGDVTLTAPGTGNLLQFNGTQWVNVPSTTVGGVTSVYGRTGAVVAAEGDYSLNLLGDVDLATAPPVVGQVLTFNGGGWVASDISIPGALVYRGQINLVTDTAPATPAVGDLYVNTGSGVVGASWTGITGVSVAGSEQVAWDGTKWGFLGSASNGSVVSVSGQNGVEEVGTAANPVLQIDRATVDGWYTPASHAGAAGNAHPEATQTDPGFLSAADKTKLDSVTAGAEPNVQADWNEVDITSDAFIRNKPTVTAPPVLSVFGRTGAVGAQTGDYTLNQLADVDVVPATSGQVLTLVGTVWRAQDLSLPGALIYRGSVDLTTDTAPATPAVGDLYVNTGAGTVGGSWTGIAGDTVAGGEQVAWNGTVWGFLGGVSSGGVQSVTAQNGVVALGTTADPILEVDRTTVDGWYTPASHVGAGGTVHPDAVPNGLSGFMSGADKAKLDAATAVVAPTTLMERDANGSVAVNVMTALVFDIDALAALP